MTQLKPTTKKAQRFINAYNRATACRLSDIYGNYSSAKEEAQFDCLRMLREENGEDFRIISANFTKFTAAWRTRRGLRVETAENSYIIA